MIRAFKCKSCDYTRVYGDEEIKREPRILTMTSLIDRHECVAEKYGDDILSPVGPAENHVVPGMEFESE